jgi:hypothetical protein
MKEHDEGHDEDRREIAHQAGQPPVVENPTLPTMAPTKKIKPSKGGQAIGTHMDREPRADRGGHGRMAPVPKPREHKGTPHGAGKGPRFPDQQRSPSLSGTESGLSYVRLRLHFEGGRLRIVGAREVAGPLTIPDYVGTGLAYEVLAGERRIGVGSLPDVNVRRAFTNIDQKEAALGHNPTLLDSYDFDVRVPKSELNVESLRSIVINLHQIDAAPSERLGRHTLSEQLGEAAKTIASLQGIRQREMAPNARTELASILRTRETG